MLERAHRRGFLKVAAFSVAGLATLGALVWGGSGGDAAVGRPASRHPIDVLNHRLMKDFDAIHAQGGKPAIMMFLASASQYDRCLLHEWIVERGHGPMVDLLVAGLGYEDLSTRCSAGYRLNRDFPPAALSPFKPQIVQARDRETNEALRDLLEDLTPRIP